MIRCKMIAVLGMTFALLGCGDSNAPPKEDLISVSGTVQIGGKPAAGVFVSFVPNGSTKGQGGSGVTDEAGKYVIEHNATHKPGVAAGEYLPNLSKWVMPDGSAMPKDKAPHMVGATNAIPASWREQGAGQHILKVQAGSATFDFDIPQG